MKGFVSTLTILLFFLVIFSLATTFSTKSLEIFDISTKNLILDKVYNKFIAIEYGIEKILEEESDYGGIKIKIQENSFNHITFNETIPTEHNNNFKTDMERFKNFTESKLNETNLVINLNFTEIEKCLPLNIAPYNISYIHPSRPECLQGQEEVKILPADSWMYVNSYTMTLKVNSSIGEVGGSRNSATCKKDATLTWNITIVGSNTIYNEVDKINPSANCNFNIKESSNTSTILFIRTDRNDGNSTLSILIQDGFIVNSSLTLNLTDVPGKIWIGLAPQSIKVKETLYQIEKNDTVYIVGD